MKDPKRFYTYAYLREDGTPYYVGKGTGKRVYDSRKRCINPPKDKSRIIFLKQNLTEEEAFKHEIYMINVFGRKDLGTGILHNKTDGGEGASGVVVSEETRKKLSEKARGENNPQYGKRGKNCHNYGRNHSEETKIKISKGNRGKKLSEETREKIGIVQSVWWKITFNDNRQIVIFGLSTWCRKRKYNKSCMLAVSNGRRKRHKDVVAVQKLSTTPHRPLLMPYNTLISNQTNEKSNCQSN